jgi:class 3 adenylate cyclase/DNA-binding CsgD family transcriptional regulator
MNSNSARRRRSIVTTVLFTDIVDSSEKATGLGDAGWRELLERHNEIVRGELKRAGGREIDTAGDGFLTAFDSPNRAIRCACAIREGLIDLGVPVRIGLHTGECEASDGKLRGVAVHIGARVAAAAGPGEVLVSSTVRDVVAGKRFQFDDRGLRALKGIPGQWRLFAVRTPATTREVGQRGRAKGLIGRARELDELDGYLRRAAGGRGGLALVAGDAGVGKTRLLEESLDRSGTLVLRGIAAERATPPYGPLVAALRDGLRALPEALAVVGHLTPHLTHLLPELGSAPSVETDRATLFEAIRLAFDSVAASRPTAVFLDDLQWADDATLELLPSLASAFEERALLLVGAYRSDEIPRGHALRRLRTELRRGDRLRELTLEPLDATESALLATRVLGRAPSPALARVLHDRTQGLPLFVEELAAALDSTGRLRQSDEGADLRAGEEVPVPDSVRDAVLLRAELLTDEARAALDLAAVRGSRFEFDLIADLVGESGLEQSLELGLVLEVERGLGAFRHALTCEAIYDAIPWSRRAALHRELAARLQASGTDAVAVAAHWLKGRQPEKARRAFLAAANRSCDLYAHRDAAQLAQRALELWPEGEDEVGRLAALERLGDCLELSGQLTAATRTWQEVLERRLSSGDPLGLARTQRRLASLYELQGIWDRALPARRAAATAHRAAGELGEAALDNLIAAGNLQGGGNFTPALELVAGAREEAERSGRVDLKVRALGLEGMIVIRMGDHARGVEMMQAGLSLALAENLVTPAAELHEKLAHALLFTSEYAKAKDAYAEAHQFCESRGVLGTADLCLACLAYILRKTGQWDEALGVSKAVLESKHAPRASRVAAGGVTGLIHALRGEARQARPFLTETFALAVESDHLFQKFDCAWGLARLDALDQKTESAADRCRFVLETWARTEDRYCAIAALRWASSLFSAQEHPAGASACADALSQIATATGNPEALSALAHALGEIALLEGDGAQAGRHFGQALDLLQGLDLPLDSAETRLRSAIALTRVGERDLAVESLLAAYEAARALGARPLMKQAVAELARLGERVEQRLGRKALRALEPGGLSRRELDVLRLVATERTNKEIAHELFLSPRTVDMHVRNILAKLGSPSRSDAVAKARELGALPVQPAGRSAGT